MFASMLEFPGVQRCSISTHQVSKVSGDSACTISPSDIQLLTMIQQLQSCTNVKSSQRTLSGSVWQCSSLSWALDETSPQPVAFPTAECHFPWVLPNYTTW